MARRTTLCLSMIVKNEAPVIARCLDSVRPIIDHWIVVDTGSTDGTQAIVRERLRGLPGALHERPWQDFAHNRTEALALARPHADYTLVIDADDTLVLPRGGRLPPLTADAYTLDIEDGSIRYQRTQIVRNTLAWRYVGVLHEAIECEDAGPAARLALTYRMHYDGARRRDPGTYARDARVLERALATEAGAKLRARYTFYLAQSYRDSGEPRKALRRYLERSELGYWSEEVYVSLLEAARLMVKLDYRERHVIEAWCKAAEAAPHRSEALHGGAAIHLAGFAQRFRAIAFGLDGKPGSRSRNSIAFTIAVVTLAAKMSKADGMVIVMLTALDPRPKELTENFVSLTMNNTLATSYLTARDATQGGVWVSRGSGPGASRDAQLINPLPFVKS